MWSKPAKFCTNSASAAGRIVLAAAVGHRLAAAGLVERIDDLDAEALEQLQRGNADLREEGVDVAGNEQSYPHRLSFRTVSELPSRKVAGRSDMIARRDISHASVAHPHGGERPEIGLERNQDANEASEGNGVEEDVPQDDALLTMLVRGRGCHDDALGIDHLAHHATRAVCRAHEGWAQTELFG